jgi:hypothetical protein
MPESGKGASNALKYAICALLAVFPFLYYGMYAGDAMIHVVYAENAAAGRFFEFNPGEKSAGITSPGYMLLVTGVFRLMAPEAVPIAVKWLNLAGWFGLLFASYRLGRTMGLSGNWALASLLVVGLMPGSAYNATIGMENGLFALVICAFALLVLAYRRLHPGARPVWAVELASAALLGLGAWLRPEGVAIAALWLSTRCYVAWRHGWAGRMWVGILAEGATVCVFVVGLLLFHHHHTGYWLPTSGVSRVLMAGRESASLGPLIVHPRFALRLAAYLPVTLLFAIGSIVALRNRREAPERAFLVAVFWTFFVLYSVVLGAVHVGRYVIFLMPLYGTIAVSTALSMVARPPKALGRSVIVLLACAVCWMGGVYWIEATQRLTLGGWSALWDLADAPRNRTATSDALIRQLGAPTRRPITLAFQEVQARYWLDERFVVRSLDGRTDRRLLRFADRREVDHLAYIRDREVDFLMELPNYNRTDSRLYTLDRLRRLPPGGTCEREGLRFRRLVQSAVVSVEPTTDPGQDVACP